MLVLIKGAGDLATGTAVRLYRAGIPVVMTEVARPTAVRRTVAFSQCMYDGAAQVEGISARRAEDAGAARRALERGAFCGKLRACQGVRQDTHKIDTVLCGK